MNLINRTFLKLALLPSGLYKKMGVDGDKLKAILQTKLIMDDRRPNSFHQTQQRKSKKPVSAATIGTMLMSTLIGLICLTVFAYADIPVTGLTFYFSIFFFMLSATLISDFTSVLIDVRDNYIILPKPVNDRTFLVGRLLHIFIHICKVVVPLCIPGLIFMAVVHGAIATVIFFILVFFITALALFVINAVYLLILKITTPARFQSIIGTIQIVFAITVYASYQVFPRLMTKMNLETLDLSSKKLIILYPIYWFAAAWKVLSTAQGTGMEIIAAALGLVVPVASLYAVVRFLAPSFNNRLALISSTSGEAPAPTKMAGARRESFYTRAVSRAVTGSLTERSSFLFTWKMMARSRDFKMKVYPSIGYLAVYVVIMLMNNRNITLEAIQEQAREGKIIVLSALYISTMLITMSINQMVFTEKYKAAWIFYIAPVSRPGEIVLGGAKAAMLKFYIPIFLFISAAALAIIGPAVLPNIFLGLVNQLLICSISVYSGYKLFPFSMMQSNNNKTGSLFRGLFILFFSGIIGIGHYVLYDMTLVIWTLTALSLLATWLILGSVRSTSWEAIRSSYAE